MVQQQAQGAPTTEDVLRSIPDKAAEFGWSNHALQEAVSTAGGDSFLAYRLFPNGIADAVEQWCEQIDNDMLAACPPERLNTMKVRVRIATLLEERFRLLQPHKQAVRNLLGYFALPWNAASGAHRLAKTADVMWQAAGDDSTDYNYYTKRGLLAAVYSSSLFFWIQQPEDAPFTELEAFIQRRLDEVLQIPACKSQLEQHISGLFPWPEMIREAFGKK